MTRKPRLRMPKVLNCTPHPVHIVGADNSITETIPASGIIIRLTATTVADQPIAGVPTSRTVFGEAVGLPDQQEGVFLIVSQLVKTALPSRSDLLVPAEVVKDSNGNIIGCRSLGR